jgi:hypothetical protein
MSLSKIICIIIIGILIVSPLIVYFILEKEKYGLMQFMHHKSIQNTDIDENGLIKINPYTNPDDDNMFPYLNGNTYDESLKYNERRYLKNRRNKSTHYNNSKYH